MSITINDNFKINAGKPSEYRYLNQNNTVYTGTTHANSSIPISLRHVGLTVNINNEEFWYKNGVTDEDLIKKNSDVVTIEDNYVTGVTNLGYFSGYTSVQEISIISAYQQYEYSGIYCSTYNHHYRNENGYVVIGTPSDGINKRAYVKNSEPIKSWVWNEYVGSNNAVGWILSDGNVLNNIDEFVEGVTYYDYPTTKPYTNSVWTGGTNNGSMVMINTVIGSLTSGTTISIGNRVFSHIDDNDIKLKTIISETPNSLSITENSSQIIFNNKATTLQNTESDGFGIYSGTTENISLLKKLIPSGGTQIIDQGDALVILSNIGDTIYNLASPSTCTVGGLPAGSELTGRSVVQILEDILVPAMNPTLINPTASVSLSVNGMIVDSCLFEIGANLSPVNFNVSFNPGSINPQYNASCNQRSCGAIGYCLNIPPNITTYISNTNNQFTYTHQTEYTVAENCQTWRGSVEYKDGVQPYNSKGQTYCSPLPSGTTSMQSKIIKGILPWFWGINDDCLSIQSSISISNKSITEVTTAPMCITFNALDKYLWFAIPSCATDRNCWWVTSTNCGFIGGESNLFASPINVQVSSSQGCWSNRNYNLYVSNFKTNTDSVMCILQ